MAVNNGIREKDEKEKVDNNQKTSVLDENVIRSRGEGTDEDIAAFLAANRSWIPSFATEFRAFFTVFTFLTRLPGPHWVDHHPGYLMMGMPYFPVVGALIGIYVSSFFDASVEVFGFPPPVAMCISTASSFWITGCFHEDGLADTTDGFGGGWTREQILSIMQDTRLGTYGCASLLLYIITKTTLVATLGVSTWKLGGCAGGGPALLLVHVVARCTASPLLHGCTYIDEAGPKGGYYSWFQHASQLVTISRVLITLAIAYGSSVALYGYTDGQTVCIMLLTSVWLAGSYGNKVLGGVMGDFLGATICMTELIILCTIHSFPIARNLRDIIIKNILQNWSDWQKHGRIDLSLVPTGVANDIDQCMTNPLFRLIVVLICIYAWSYAMSLIRRTKISRNISDDDCERTSVDVATSSESSFSERFEEAQRYIDSLAKPVGSLGTLEKYAARLCALQRRKVPVVNAGSLVFIGDHGVAALPSDGGEGCCAYPQAVTRAVARIIDEGKGGISVLSNSCGSFLRAIDVGICTPSDEKKVDEGFLREGSFKIPTGTANFCKQEAMSLTAVHALLKAGGDAVDDMLKERSNITVLAIGEVGMGNTTTAATLYAALTEALPENVCGTGSGLDLKGVLRKQEIVKQALQVHCQTIESNDIPRILAAIGGTEIVAMAGAMLQAHRKNIAVVVGGYISTCGALVAARIYPRVTESFFLSSVSTEQGHLIGIKAIQNIADKENLPPLSPPALDMKLHMGEATACTLLVPILRASASIMEMAKLADVV